MVEQLWFCIISMVEHKQFKLDKLGQLGKLVNLTKKNFGKPKLSALTFTSNMVKERKSIYFGRDRSFHERFNSGADKKY